MERKARRTAVGAIVCGLVAFAPSFYPHFLGVHIFHKLVTPHIPAEISNIVGECSGSFIDKTSRVTFDFKAPAAALPMLAQWHEVCADARKSEPAKGSMEEQDRSLCDKWPVGYRDELRYLFFDDATGKGELYSPWGEGC